MLQVFTRWGRAIIPNVIHVHGMQEIIEGRPDAIPGNLMPILRVGMMFRD